MNIHKKSKKWVALLMALCLLLLSVFAVVSSAKAYEPGKYITYEAMNFRTAPSLDAEIITVFPEYTTVEVTEISGSFGKLTYDGITGWMSLDYSSYLSEIPKEITDTWYVADLSIWNGTINWDGLRGDGIEGVILRIGGRGYGSAKALYADTAFPTYYRRAKAAGLHVGVYFFSYAMNEEMAREEAEYTLALLRENECELDMPVFIDMEDADDDLQHYNAGRDVCTRVVDAYCTVIEQAGYYAGVYTGTWFAQELINPAVFENRGVWMAHYGVDECGYKDYPIDMWQYTNKGVIRSIDGYVDLNECYVDYPAIVAGYTPHTPPDEDEPDPTSFGEHVPADGWTVVKEASCTQAGIRTKVCKDCGITLVEQAVSPTDHQESEEMLLLLAYLHKPGDVLTAEEIIRLHPKSDPNYDVLYKPGFELTGGMKPTSCTSCKKILTAEYSIPLCTHNSPKDSRTEPTCTKDGLSMTTCSVCSNNVSGEVLPATKHKKGEPVNTYATCTQSGTARTSCTVCGETVATQFLPPVEHQFRMSQVITQATLSSGGEELYLCTVCGAEERRAIAPLTLGDITTNGVIDAEDARIALRVSVALEEVTPSGMIAGDTDNDGFISAADARNILRIAVGLTSPEKLKETYYGLS